MRKILSVFLALALMFSVTGIRASAAEADDVISVSSLSELQQGEYELSASLNNYMPAMGGCNLAANLLEAATLQVEENGTISVTLDFKEVAEWSSAYFSGQLTHVEAQDDIVYYNGSEWVNAQYTTSSAVDGEGAGYTYVDTMTFPISTVNNTYDLGMYMSGYQFGGSNPSKVSSGTAMTSTLTVDWDNVTVVSVVNADDNSGSTDTTGTLVSGKYAVDISWSPMGSMFAPILEIDAEAMTFKLYNETDPATGKGAGTVSYSDGTYTLTYENGNTTTFTYEDGVITFTSKLWYGSASFNQSDDNGNFVPYTAAVKEAVEEEESNTEESNTEESNTEDSNTEESNTEESNTEDSSNDATDNNSSTTEDSNSSTTNDNSSSAATEKEESSEKEEESSEVPKTSVISVTSLSELKPGTYGLSADLTCWLSAMGGVNFGSVMSHANLNVAEDGSASITMYFYGDAEITMMYGTTTTCVNPIGEIGYFDGSQWQSASYTTGTATDEEGNEYTYVSSMTFPIYSVSDTYEVALYVGGGSMGAQFGGNSAQMISDGSILSATLAVDWSRTYTNPVTSDGATATQYVVVMALAVCGLAALMVWKKREA